MARLHRVCAAPICTTRKRWPAFQKGEKQITKAAQSLMITYDSLLKQRNTLKSCRSFTQSSIRLQ
ncbi:MAG: hypothetical protein ACLTA4_12085 [Clostridium sp.]